MVISSDSHILEGDEIKIEEMPSGCVISHYMIKNRYIQISSRKDALLVMESLIKMLRAWDKNGYRL